MTREEIMIKFKKRLSAVLRGEEKSIDVCGLSVEAMRAEILAERDKLLKEHGYDCEPTPAGDQ